MSDATKRDAVVEEFCPQRYRESPWQTIRKLAAEDMADEIARLRDENAALRAEIDRLREERDALLAWKAENQRAIVEVVVDLLAAGVVPKGSKGLRDGVNGAIAALDTMRHRADRAERILAALEGWLPDDVDRQYDALYTLCGDSDDSTIRCAVANLRNANRIIRAAVIAAEREVGGE